MELIGNELEKGRKFINKLSAGERQLSAAIKMYFLEMDPVAIHTVSSAAHNVFADLLKDRGKDPSVHGVLYGLLRAAKDLHDGKLTEDNIREWGDSALELVQQYRSVFENDTDLDVGEISSAAPPEYARSYWAKKRFSYNFLKHADRDSNGLLDEGTINNEDTILQAIICSQHLNIKNTAEKHFYICAMYALGKLKGRSDFSFDLEVMMSGMSRNEIMTLGRRNICQLNFEDDDTHIESAAQKMKENATRIEGMNISFFDPK